ncbi:MAG: DUF5683 domain-containing protein [Bacteroidota bacterium]
MIERPMKDYFRLLLLLFCWWGLSSASLIAQIDTTRLSGSLRQDSLRTLSDVEAAIALQDSLFAAQADTTPLTLKEKIQKTVQNIEAGLPEIYEEEKKTKLKLKFPWRDDIVLPFPKGALPAPRPPPFDPTIAWQRALLIPTLGQIYNRRYWKVPIFLIGYGGAVWWASYNNQQYGIYGDAFLCKVSETPCDPGPDFQGLDSDGIRNRRNSFRQNRDYAVLGVVGWHLISVAEAFVDAHLRGFDVSEDLTSNSSWELKPSFEPIGLSDGTLGVGMGIRLRF